MTENDKWKLRLSISCTSRERMIETFEDIIVRIRKVDFVPSALGSSNCSYSIEGPDELPLSNNEIRKLRDMIR